MKNFGKRLTMLLEEKNMTQSELAEKAHTTNATISRYITGEREPKVENVIAIANCLDTSVDYLLGVTEEKLSTAKNHLATSEELSKASNLLNRNAWGMGQAPPTLRQTGDPKAAAAKRKSSSQTPENWTDEDVKLMRHIKQLGDNEKLMLLDYLDYLENRRKN